MDKITTPASYFTSGTMTVLGGLTINEWMAVTGIILGVATFALNWFYKRKADKRAISIDKIKQKYPELDI